MINVMFVCHGNICRSTMAEFLFRDKVEKMGLGHMFNIASSATSREEIGNGVHYGTARVLDAFDIDYSMKRAVQLKESDKEHFDYFIGMDSANIRNMKRILGEANIARFLDYSERPRDIADPWYSGDFNATYNDVIEGSECFLEYLRREGKI